MQYKKTPAVGIKYLDRASIRSFQHKIVFDYLTPEGNLIFYQKLLSSLVAEPLDPVNRARLMELSNLTPGDFKTVRDRYNFVFKEEIAHKIIVKALIAEAKVKKPFPSLFANFFGEDPKLLTLSEIIFTSCDLKEIL